jgi:hypothetical protein
LSFRAMGGISRFIRWLRRQYLTFIVQGEAWETSAWLQGNSRGRLLCSQISRFPEEGAARK